MNQVRLSILPHSILALALITALMSLAACSTVNTRDTIATLRDQSVEVQGERIEGGLDKAMVSYQRFLEETSDSELKPEALRRLADLKIEKEYGTLTEGAEPSRLGESGAQFERRTTLSQPPGSAAAATGKRADGASDLERAAQPDNHFRACRVATATLLSSQK